MSQRKRESTSYIGTFDADSASDMLQLEDLRGMVSMLNKALRFKTGKTFRIVSRGRKPRVKMMVGRSYLYQGSTRPISYSFSGNIVGGIVNATRIDAYLYERR